MQKTPVPPPRAKQKVVFSGWLRKQGGQFKSLRTRWFEIKGDQLYYFRDKADPKPLGVVPLAGNEVVKYPREENDPGKFKFEIRAGKDRDGRQVIDGHDTFVLIASTIEEMDQWVGVINRIIYQPFGGGMFGGDLSETIRFEARKGGGFVPIIMDTCIEKIRQDGLDEEGLFRLPGNMKITGDLKSAFNKGENPDISDSDIHTVSSLLKMYLRELPEPLIPYDFFEVFLTSAKCYEMYEEDGIKSIQKHLTQLPKANFNLLKVLCRFLFEVQEHSGVNKMDTRNIAMVFGPNILRSGSEDPQVMMESTAQVTALVSILIRRHEIFFPPTEDEHHYTRDIANGTSDQTQTGLLIDLEQDTSLPANYDPKSPSGNFIGDDMFSSVTTRNGPVTDSQTPEMQLEELENETRLQQQQIEDLKTKLEGERKVREMLLIRLNDEKRAREAAEERLRKMNEAIDEFNAKHGGFSF